MIVSLRPQLRRECDEVGRSERSLRGKEAHLKLERLRRAFAARFDLVSKFTW
jgi:hypothetical protein